MLWPNKVAKCFLLHIKVNQRTRNAGSKCGIRLLLTLDGILKEKEKKTVNSVNDTSTLLPVEVLYMALLRLNSVNPNIINVIRYTIQPRQRPPKTSKRYFQGWQMDVLGPCHFHHADTILTITRLELLKCSQLHWHSQHALPAWQWSWAGSGRILDQSVDSIKQGSGQPCETLFDSFLFFVFLQQKSEN